MLAGAEHPEPARKRPAEPAEASVSVPVPEGRPSRPAQAYPPGHDRAVEPRAKPRPNASRDLFRFQADHPRLEDARACARLEDEDAVGAGPGPARSLSTRSSRWTRNTSESGTVAPVSRWSPSCCDTEGCAKRHALVPTREPRGLRQGCERDDAPHWRPDCAGPDSWQPPKDAEIDSGIGQARLHRGRRRGPRLELPGEYPFTRGPYADMYRGRRLGRSDSTPGSRQPRRRTSASVTHLLERVAGLSVAFDLPQLGYDSDDARAPKARWGGPVSQSTRSPTWSCCSTASR